jgi:hypothetical protein
VLCNLFNIGWAKSRNSVILRIAQSIIDLEDSDKNSDTNLDVEDDSGSE